MILIILKRGALCASYFTQHQQNVRKKMSTHIKKLYLCLLLVSYSLRSAEMHDEVGSRVARILHAALEEGDKHIGEYQSDIDELDGQIKSKTDALAIEEDRFAQIKEEHQAAMQNLLEGFKKAQHMSSETVTSIKTCITTLTKQRREKEARKKALEDLLAQKLQGFILVDEDVQQPSKAQAAPPEKPEKKGETYHKPAYMPFEVWALLSENMQRAWGTRLPDA